MLGKKLVSVYVIFVLSYLWLIFVIPPSNSAMTNYNLTSAQVTLLQLTVALPLIIIWGLAFFAYSRFSRYALVVKKSAEGTAFSKLATGLFLLALWLPLTSLVSNVTTHIYREMPDTTAQMVIVNNYFNLAITAFAIVMIYRGAKALIPKKNLNANLQLDKLVLPVFIILSYVYAYLSLTSSVRHQPAPNVAVATFYMSDWLIALTIVLPYIILFYLGLRSAQYLYIFSRNVRGVIYKETFRRLASGIGLVVIAMIGIRYITSLRSIFSTTALGLVLTIVYLLLLIVTFGFLQIATGAKRLYRIEEV